MLKPLACCALMLAAVSARADEPAAPVTSPAATAPARPASYLATLLRIEGESLVVVRTNGPGPFLPPQTAPATQPDKADEITLATTTKTTFSVDAEKAALADLKPGMSLQIISGPDSRLIIMAETPYRAATLVKVDGNSLVVANNQHQQITVTLDDHVKVIFLGAYLDGKFTKGGEHKLSDLQPGMPLRILPAARPAQKIITRPLPPPTTIPTSLP
jgi:hypothetical protein